MHYSLSRATLWNLAGYLYLAIASLISIPILVSSLGLAEFGHYALVIATITLASSIDLGLSAAVVRALSRKSQDPKRHHIWSTSHALFFVTGLVAATVAAIIVSGFESPYFIIPLVFFHTLFGHILAHYLTLPQALGDFHLYNLRNFIVGTANTFLAAFLASIGFKIDILLLSQLFASFLTILLLARYAYRHFGTLPRTVSRSHSRDLLSFGVKNQLGKLVNQLSAQYAKFLLAPAGALSVSAYTIAQGLVLKAAGGLTQLSTALYPASSRQAGHPSLRKLYYRLQLALTALIILGLVLYYLFGLAFLDWWLNDVALVTAVHSILTILVWYLALLVLTSLPSIILDSHNRPGLSSLLGTSAFAIELVVAISLLPTQGVLAPALGALTSLIIMLPILLILTHQTLLTSPLGKKSRSDNLPPPIPVSDI